MKRTQIILEGRQHEALAARARATDRSISAIVREAVDVYLVGRAGGRKTVPISGLCGIFRGKGGPSGRDHDKVLYSSPK